MVKRFAVKRTDIDLDTMGVKWFSPIMLSAKENIVFDANLWEAEQRLEN